MPQSNSQGTAAKSIPVQLPQPDTHDQTVRMSDADFDAGITQAVKNVQQNKDKQDIDTQSKRVRISTKRYIHEY